MGSAQRTRFDLLIMKQTSSSVQSDVIVVGGGMVGSLTAAAFANCGLDVTVLEKVEPKAFSRDQHDIRVSAISVATQRMFQAVGSWDAMQEMRVCPFRRMSVWDSETSGATRFNSADIGREQLGHIVENRVIQQALWRRLQELDNVRLMCPVDIAGISVGEDHAGVTLEGGMQLTAPLIVAADGANSQMRGLAGIEVDGEAYDQHALVATVRTAEPQQDITWQRFTPHGPQAFLPLTENRASMVWYHDASIIDELKKLPAGDFLQRMQDEFPDCLGRLTELEAIGSFPLRWQQAHSYVKPRIALVGDAAHSVHPLAGQGVNMGMLDAAALVESVMRRHADGYDIGGMRCLRSYERWRKGSNMLMIKLLDGIAQVFQSSSSEVAGSVKKTARSLALSAAGQIGPINNLCMKAAMGLGGDLPLLARGRLPVKTLS